MGKSVVTLSPRKGGGGGRERCAGLGPSLLPTRGRGRLRTLVPAPHDSVDVRRPHRVTQEARAAVTPRTGVSRGSQGPRQHDALPAPSALTRTGAQLTGAPVNVAVARAVVGHSLGRRRAGWERPQHRSARGWGARRTGARAQGSAVRGPLPRNVRM